MKELNRKLKLARQFHGWTQERAAWESGVSRIQISHIESGKADPQISTVAKLVTDTLLDFVSYRVQQQWVFNGES